LPASLSHYNSLIAPRFIGGLRGNFGSKEDETFEAEFTNKFKRDAVAQVEDRSYLVQEVSERRASAQNQSTLGSGCFRGRRRWSKRSIAQADEMHHLRWDLASVSEEADS
jgi:transposase